VSEEDTIVQEALLCYTGFGVGAQCLHGAGWGGERSGVHAFPDEYSEHCRLERDAYAG
jgi:hypothetical protein